MNNSFVFKNNHLLILISIISLLFNINSNLNFLLHILILFLVFTATFKQGILIYIFESIWIFSIYQGEYQIFIYLLDIIIFVKALIFVLKEDIKFRTRDYIFFVIVILYSVLCIILYKDLSVTRLFLCTFIVFSIRMYFVKTKNDTIIKDSLKYFLFSLIISVLFGYLHQNYIVERFFGVHSPNYMGLYLNIGLIITFFTDIIKNKFKLVVAFYLIVAVFLTKSTSALGISSTIIFLFVLISLYKFRKNINFKLIFILPISFSIIILVLFMSNIEIKFGAIDRVLNRIEMQNSFDLSVITNARASLWEIYFNLYLNFGYPRILFGSAIFSPLEYTNLDAAAHSNYIDILWFVGIIGLLGLLYIVFLNLMDYKNSKYFQCLLVIKIVFLINMFSISLLSSRFFNLLFFL